MNEIYKVDTPFKKISILGSTGSIGTQTLEVVAEHGDIEVTALACGRNIKLLEEQMRQFHPKLVAVENEKLAEEIRVRTEDLGIPVMSGMDGLIAVATEEHAQHIRILLWRIRRHLLLRDT